MVCASFVAGPSGPTVARRDHLVLGRWRTMRLVVLSWAIIWLNYSMEHATRLIAVVAFGTAFGAILAGRFVALKKMHSQYCPRAF